MTDHMTLLAYIQAEEIELAFAQARLEMAREIAPESQLVQLTMDRRQREIDEALAKLEICKYTIPMSN